MAISADILEFKSRFDLDAEAAVAAALFGIAKLEQLTQAITRKRLEMLDNPTQSDCAPSESR